MDVLLDYIENQPGVRNLHDFNRDASIVRMSSSLLSSRRLRVTVALVVVAIGAGAWVRQVEAQAAAQIGTNSPLPVLVTNPVSTVSLPEGFVQGSQWRFTTWTLPSVITWTADVNKVSGAWANLTITTDSGKSTRWYYLPAMPGSWEPL
jgi:hypothetical protein